MWYNVDWKRLVLLLLPTFLRSEKITAFCSVLVGPIEALHYDWLQYRADNLYNLGHNSQKCYLRAALNDRFDVQLRRIRIEEGNKHKRFYIYTDAEKKPKHMGTIYLHQDSDYDDTGVDFIVVVPADLVYNPYEMTALVDFYRLASKRYKIVKQ